MANVKISALPAATTINAADLLPVVQGGVTKQVTPDLLPISVAAAAALAGKDTSGAAAAAQAAAIQRANHTGTQSADTITDGTTNKVLTAAERTKLTGIAPGATANRADTATDAAIAAATAALVNSAPGTLDTLGELASALTADEGAAATLATLVGTKAPLASPAFTGTPTIGGTAVAKTSDVTTAVTAQAATDAATYAAFTTRNDMTVSNPKGFLSYQGTDPAATVTIKPSTDSRAGVWELVNAAPTGYVFHLMTGAGVGSGAALIGLGVDNGGVGLFVNNKTTGIGIKIDQNASITSGTAYGMQVTQKSTVAPAVFAMQDAPGAYPAIRMWATGAVTDDADVLQQWLVGASATEAGAVTAKTGTLRWKADVVALGSKVRSRVNDGSQDVSTNHIVMDSTGWEIDATSGSGSAGNGWWVGRIYRNGWAMDFQAGQGFSNQGGAGTTMNTLIRLSYGGKLGFFGSDGVAAAATLPAAATDAATTQTLANSLRTALIALGLAQ